MTYARVSSAWAKLIASLFPSLCVVRPGKTDRVPVSVLGYPTRIPVAEGQVVADNERVRVVVAQLGLHELERPLVQVDRLGYPARVAVDIGQVGSNGTPTDAT
jgi:hypothetical protein